MHNPIDSRQLANFCEVVDAHSMRKAAKNLNLTTSAISHSLKRLENDLGCKLFERDTRNLALTHAGRRLYSVADSLLEGLTKTRYLMQDWGQIHQKTLRIGATSAACQYIIPMALRELKESFPGMNIQIFPGSSYQLLGMLGDNKIDVAIFPWGRADKKSHTSIATDELEFIVNPLHAWAANGKVDLDTLESERLILTDSKGYTFDLVQEYFQAVRKNLMPFIEISNEEVIKSLVQLDIGIGILPRWMIQEEIENGSLVSLPLGRKKLKRHWIAAHREGKELTFSESLFIGVATNVAQSLFSNLIH